MRSEQRDRGAAAAAAFEELMREMEQMGLVEKVSEENRLKVETSEVMGGSLREDQTITGKHSVVVHDGDNMCVVVCRLPGGGLRVMGGPADGAPTTVVELLPAPTLAPAPGNDEMAELGDALERYTDPTHPEYDAEFDAQIRASRPDWFDDRE